MEAAVWGFLGVVVGGALTVVGQATAEAVKARFATAERQERRNQLSREFQRATMLELLDKMAAYRAALARDMSQELPSPDSEAQQAAARTAYQMLVHRVSATGVRGAAQAWETEALRWFQRDDRGSAAQEAATWLTAMRLTGEAIRQTD